MSPSPIYARGKLLLTGEYALLDGALALGLPTRMGQTLQPFEHAEPGLLRWESLTPEGHPWFEAHFKLADFSPIHTTSLPTASRLQHILKEIRERNPHFLKGETAPGIRTELEFPLAWGLGSSSTLLSNMATWGGVDPFWLQRQTFGGSGYDIACARSDQPILYQNLAGTPRYTEVDFSPAFADHLYFVYLNRKQDTRAAIAAYRRAAKREDLVSTLSEITREVLKAGELATFEALLTEHEQAVGQVLGMPPVKTRLFADYPHTVKSLGAWGGDFVLAVGDQSSPAYFSEKGFDVSIPYRDMVR